MHKIDWKEFSELSKKVFIEVAAKEYGISGRQTNTSKISLLTSIPRKEVSRLRKESIPHDKKHHDYGYTVGHILSKWYTDPNYLDKRNRPLVLKISGNKPSFETLVKEYGNGALTESVMNELTNAKSAKQLRNDKIKTTKRIMPVPIEMEESMTYLFSVLRDFSESILNNTTNEQEPILRGEATEIGIPADKIPEFKSFMKTKGKKFFKEVDAWLLQNQSSDHSKNHYRVGAGAYTIISKEEQVNSHA